RRSSQPATAGMRRCGRCSASTSTTPRTTRRSTPGRCPRWRRWAPGRTARTPRSQAPASPGRALAATVPGLDDGVLVVMTEHTDRTDLEGQSSTEPRRLLEVHRSQHPQGVPVTDEADVAPEEQGPDPVQHPATACGDLLDRLAAGPAWCHTV